MIQTHLSTLSATNIKNHVLPPPPLSDNWSQRDLKLLNVVWINLPQA